MVAATPCVAAAHGGGHGGGHAIRGGGGIMAGPCDAGAMGRPCDARSASRRRSYDAWRRSAYRRASCPPLSRGARRRPSSRRPINEIFAPTCRASCARRARSASWASVPRPWSTWLRPAFICPRQCAGRLPTGDETSAAECAGPRTRQSLRGASLQRAQRAGVRGPRIRAGLRAPSLRSGVLPSHALCRRILAGALFLALRLLRRDVLALAVRL